MFLYFLLLGGLAKLRQVFDSELCFLLGACISKGLQAFIGAFVKAAFDFAFPLAFFKACCVKALLGLFIATNLAATP